MINWFFSQFLIKQLSLYLLLLALRTIPIATDIKRVYTEAPKLYVAHSLHQWTR